MPDSADPIGQVVRLIDGMVRRDWPATLDDAPSVFPEVELGVEDHRSDHGLGSGPIRSRIVGVDGSWGARDGRLLGLSLFVGSHGTSGNTPDHFLELAKRLEEAYGSPEGPDQDASELVWTVNARELAIARRRGPFGGELVHISFEVDEV